jgi:hypothetical protein
VYIHGLSMIVEKLMMVMIDFVVDVVEDVFV